MVKQPFGLKQLGCVFSMKHTYCKLMQCTGWAKTTIRSSLVPPCSPINAFQGREMYPRGSIALAKAICKSRHNYQWSTTLCFWVEHECHNFLVQTKNGLQLLCRGGQFSQIRTYIYTCKHERTYINCINVHMYVHRHVRT